MDSCRCYKGGGLGTGTKNLKLILVQRKGSEELYAKRGAGLAICRINIALDIL